MRDRHHPDDPESNAPEAMYDAAFSRQISARIDRHRRRRRRIHALGALAATLAAAAALAFLPASPIGPAWPGVGDIVAAMGLIAACSIAWLLADARSRA